MKKGFTLIELLAVILILGIIALIAIPAVTNVIEDSKRHASEVTALSYIKAINDQNALYKLQPDKFTPITSGDVDDIIVNLKGDGPTSGTVTIENGKVTEAELCASGYTVTYNGVSTTVEGKCGTAVTNKSLLGYIGTIEETGIYQTTINNVTYDLNVIVLEGNQTITANTSYGTLDDCASGTGANQMATRMVVVKVNGNYTVNSGVTVAPTYNTTYGGPKGFLLYVTGTLTNNGTIDNSHGAYAEGQNVYLWKNKNRTYEYVPALGASGGVGTEASNNLFGKSGEDGTLRSTGGGGSYRAYSSGHGMDIKNSGASGTSYSGGVGAGDDGTPSPNGGSSNSGFLSGAGNPAASNDGSITGPAALNGTGGLLIVYADNLVNNGSITALGYKGGRHNHQGSGSSGGGSINIFYKGTLTQGTINTSGGERAVCPEGDKKGGAGGTGSIAVGKIVNGSYTDTYHNWSN